MKRCPEIHYRVEEEQITIVSFYGPEGAVAVPEQIDGKAVIKIGPYGFSESQEEETDVYIDIAEKALFGEEWTRLSTTEITEVYLPKSLNEIGRYAFYRCFSLRKLVLTDNLMEIGAGAFTGCRPKEIEIDLYSGEASCLKTIVDEIRYTLYVTLRYHRKDGSIETARVVFPEHYEEAVENTPARILETRYHGSGGNYRQCFYDRELNYKEYDDLLPYAVSQETKETLSDMILSRLRFPFRLGTEAKSRYEACLYKNFNHVSQLLITREDIEGLRFLAEQGYWTKDTIDQAVVQAVEQNKTMVLGMLMDEQYKRFPKKKKVFEL